MMAVEREGPVTGQDLERLLRNFVRRYYGNCALFVREQLGVEPEPHQLKVLDELDAGERQESIRSGKGIGKTATAAWVCVHRLTTRAVVKILVTAPSGPQLFDALYPEIVHWFRKLPREIQDLYFIGADRIERLEAKESAFLSARTARAEQPEAMQGMHAIEGDVLVVIDEASGVVNPVFNAISGIMSQKNAATLLLSNPKRGSGFFYETHHKLAHLWKTHQWSCLDSKLVTPEFIESHRVLYGEDSADYRADILGEFPNADQDTIIPLELIVAAMERKVDVNPKTPVCWGFDVSRSLVSKGDECVLLKRKGNWVNPQIKTWRGLDIMGSVGRIVQEWNADIDRPAEILVDSIGLGSGVVDRLRELDLPVRGVNVSETPSMSDRFLNLRAELWIRCKEWFEKRDCSIPESDELRSQLAAVRYVKNPRSDGKIQVMAKDDLKKIMGRSPDWADALILTFGGQAAIALYGYSMTGNWRKPIRRNLPCV